MPAYSKVADRCHTAFGRLGAVHSIEYDGLSSHFYLFGVRHASSGEWFAWDDVVGLAHLLGLPHAPVWWRGTLTG